MYIINRKQKKFNNKTFRTYEAARSYIRKWLRNNRSLAVKIYNNSNPAINSFGFSIKSL